MIYLPAATGRTTQHLRHTGIVAAVVGGALIIVIVVAEIYSAGGHGAGAHLSLYAGVGVCAVVSASCLSFAFARELIGQSTVAANADRARAEETLRQVVAELARMRAADRERAALVEAMTVVVERLGRRVEELEGVVCEVGVMKVLTGPTQRLTHR